VSRLSDLVTQWLTRPRILRLLEEQTVVRAMVGLVSLPTELMSLRERCLSNLARFLGLASADRVSRLERVLTRLEQDLDRLKSRPGIH
jgi:hypothetical protein